MKIAIVAPCPVPYMVGGAEKLWWGLATHLNERTEHQAEIIKLPTPEHDLKAIVAGYEAFAALDLDSFDIVISGKYPAWMVRHPRHVCYMLHRLRGLYDCYHGAKQLPTDVASHRGIAALRTFMRRNAGSRTALAEFFGRWHELLADGGRPPSALDFPGPLGREVVHWLDGIGLSPAAISRYAAISATVAQRPGYFPEGVEVGVAHPPPHRAIPPGDRFAHFYTVSRLDVPKRVALVVSAMRKVNTPLPLIVGGSGPEQARLRDLADGDPRIRFAGFQSDDEVAASYRDALAVPFVPWQEDYGLIAVEAMQAGKPVITTVDAGGPCELVEDGVNGMVVEASVDALAAAMQRLADDPERARALGQKGIERASRVTWDAVARTLLAVPRSKARAPGAPRRKIVVASTFAIYPPRHGGASRSFHIYRALAPEFETVIVSLCAASEPPFEGEIAPGVREIRIPKSHEHERREHEIQQEVGTPVTDVVMPELHVLTPRFLQVLDEESRDACAVVASHPYLYPALEPIGLPVWLEAQDYELGLKTALFEKLPRGEEFISVVRGVEGACALAAQVILCASRDDAASLVRTYGVDPSRVRDVPNGTDGLRIGFTEPEERRALRQRMGVAEHAMAFFMGSGHWPNIEAVKRIFEFAAAMPDVVFAVVGSVCYAFDPRLKPGNVLFLGEVDEVTRNLCLQASDVAINPMEHGSGTNLKMLDFFAAGLPVITTEYGCRGLGLRGEEQCLVRVVQDFPAAIEETVGEGAAAAQARALAARRLVDEEFDWEVIVGRVKAHLVTLADRTLAERAGVERKTA